MCRNLFSSVHEFHKHEQQLWSAQLLWIKICTHFENGHSAYVQCFLLWIGKIQKFSLQNGNFWYITLKRYYQYFCPKLSKVGNTVIKLFLFLLVVVAFWDFWTNIFCPVGPFNPKAGWDNCCERGQENRESLSYHSDLTNTNKGKISGSNSKRLAAPPSSSWTNKMLFSSLWWLSSDDDLKFNDTKLLGMGSPSP